MEKVTYGIKNKIEYTALLHAGKTRISVHFKGGGISAYGVTPATFTTSNPLYQRIIESSAEFAQGKITVEKRVAIGQKEKAASQRLDKLEKPVAAKPMGGNGVSGNIQKVTEDDQSTCNNSGEDAESLNPGEVKVSGREDAAQWLKDNYGLKLRDLRTVSAVQQAAKEHGITFIGLD